MTMLISGVALWIAAHMFRRVAPKARARMGTAGRGLVAVLVLGSLVMMVVGYQTAPSTFFWGRTPALTGINNLLVLLAVYLMVASFTRSRVVGLIRHPMLTAVKSWAVAHLLVNGDSASFILFGGLLAWAVATVILINRTEGKPPLTSERSVLRELASVVGTVVVFGAMAYVHMRLGYPVFG